MALEQERIVKNMSYEINYGCTCRVHSNIICDICHESCVPKSLNKDDPITEFVELKGSFGYYSENPCRDLESHHCYICQPCYEKLKTYIESEMKGKININYYYPITERK